MSDPLVSAILTKAQAGVLGLLFSRPDESFYLRQVAQLSGLGLGHIQRELARLSEAGIIQRSRVGRHVFFQADPRCPVYQELRSIISKTVGAVSIIREALAPLSARIVVAFIFGSVARSQERKASDVDLMVIGSADFREVCALIGPAEKKLFREINPAVYSPEEFCDRIYQNHHFLTRVVNDQKLFVIGDEHELSSLSPKCLGQTP